MRLYGLRIVVSDLAAAKRFYGETLGLKQEWEWEGLAVGYDVGGPQFIVEQDDSSHGGESLVGRFLGCSIAVDDIEATWRDLTAKGVEFLGPPEKMPWGGTLAHFRDPSSNTLPLLG